MLFGPVWFTILPSPWPTVWWGVKIKSDVLKPWSKDITHKCRWQAMRFLVCMIQIIPSTQIRWFLISSTRIVVLQFDCSRRQKLKSHHPNSNSFASTDLYAIMCIHLHGSQKSHDWSQQCPYTGQHIFISPSHGCVTINQISLFIWLHTRLRKKKNGIWWNNLPIQVTWMSWINTEKHVRCHHWITPNTFLGCSSSFNRLSHHQHHWSIRM